MSYAVTIRRNNGYRCSCCRRTYESTDWLDWKEEAFQLVNNPDIDSADEAEEVTVIDGETGEEIAKVARSLFASFPMKKRIRLIGVSAGELQGRDGDPQQLQLFGEQSTKEKLSQTVDQLNEKFGSDAVRRGSQLL